MIRPRCFVLILSLTGMGLADSPAALASTMPTPSTFISADTVPRGEASHFLQEARGAADQGDLAEAGTILTTGLQRFPDHPELLAELAGLRFREGRFAEVQFLAQQLVEGEPSSEYGWELLAAARYMQDDTMGALEAWRRSRPPIIRSISVSMASPSGPLRDENGSTQQPFLELRPGDPLLPDEMVLARRRLASVPSVDRSRLDYRMGPGHEADLEGAVLLGSRSPFSRLESAGHLLRAVTGRVQLSSSGALRQWERWELGGSLEGRQRQVYITVAHPSHGGTGNWRWAVSHHSGHFVSAVELQDQPEEASGSQEAFKTRSTRLEGGYTQWLSARTHGSLRLKLDARGDGPTYGGLGGEATLLPLHEWGGISAGATGWLAIPGSTQRPDSSPAGRPYGYLHLTGALLPPPPPLLSSLSLRGSLMGVSRDAPPDRAPRIGNGRYVDLLMRAESDLTSEGRVKSLFPGRAWAWGSVEAERRLGRLGPLTVSLAVFGDLIRVLAAEDPGDGPLPDRSGVHLGGGFRVEAPGVPDRLRLDWAVNPSNGTSSLSAGWTLGWTSIPGF